MKRRMYVIPGFGGKVDNKDAGVRRFLKIISGRFEVIPVNIDWKRKVMTDFASQFIQQYDFSYKGENYIFGFSFGAYISFITSPYTKPDMQILASLSPLFREDLKRSSKNIRKGISMKLKRDLYSYSFNDTALKISKETYNVLFVGDKEDKESLVRVRDAHRKLEGSKLFVCKDAGHDLFNKNYLETLSSFVSKL